MSMSFNSFMRGTPYNIVSDTDLKEAAQKQEAYLKGRDGYKKVTMSDLANKKGLAEIDQTPIH
jgi:hypothetical protein